MKGSMVVRHATADAFLHRCASWLSQSEDLNHGLLSLADALRSKRHIHSPPFIFCHIEKNKEICGCAIFAEPDGIVLSEMTPESSAALFPTFFESVGVPSRIFGPVEPANRLAEIFAAEADRANEVHSRWQVYRLDKLRAHEIGIPGRLVKGTMESENLIRDWGKQYNVEKPANVDIEQFLLRKLEDGLVYYWVDGEPKSLATLSGRFCLGPRISAVFTPRAARGNGYAFALVYRLSKKLLSAGSAYITLNTQTGEPVERMYEKIGYRSIGKKVSINFR
jgi:GNAT superfamily N-acetyltransferase